MKEGGVMVVVKLSQDKEIVLPESLAAALGLREGDHVTVEFQDYVLRLQPDNPSSDMPCELTTGSLTDLAKLITSSRPVGSVNVEDYMDKYGYEQFDGSENL